MDFRLTHIPFGLSTSNGSIVDVQSVSRGKDCKCVCPSCRTPLVARQGKENVWHFAHASRHVYDKTENECAFSFYLSVRFMARQLIDGELPLALPELTDHVSRYVEELGAIQEMGYSVPTASSIVLKQCRVEVMFRAVLVDIKGKVEDFDFVVYFLHPGRTIPPEFEKLNGEKVGVIAINLERLIAEFAKASSRQESYAKVLTDFLRNDLPSKRWIYHPRHAALRKQAEEKLEQAVAQAIKSHKDNQERSQVNSRRIDAAPVSKRPVACECLYCGTRWDGQVPGLNRCPKCNDYLGTCVVGKSGF